MKITKLQLDTITSTLNQRAQNHFKAKSEMIIAKTKPSAETLKLQNELKTILEKVDAHNNKVKTSNKFGYTINYSTYRSEVETAAFGYASVYFPSLGSISVAPDVADEAKNAADDISNYILRLTLGQETPENLDAFLAGLLK